MEDEVFRVELGNEVLSGDDKGAFFKVVGALCIKYFGIEESSRSLIDKVERVSLSGNYVKLSRLVVRNLGCIIGSIIELDYFEPSDSYRFGLPPEDDESDVEDIQDYAVFYGRRMLMTFDTSDGSFHKSEALAKLAIDELGDHEIDDMELFECVDEYDDRDEDDDLMSLLIDEAGTPTVDDHFILNTAAMLLDNR